MGTERKIIQVDTAGPRLSKEKRKRRNRALILLTVLAAGVAFTFFMMNRSDVKVIGDYTISTVKSGNLTLSTEASGDVVLPMQVTIVSPEEGYASSLDVEVGTTVTTHTVLAVLEDPDLIENIDDYTSSLATSIITLEELEAENVFTIRDLEVTYTRLLTDIEEAEEDVAQNKALSQLKSSRESDYEDSLNDLKDLQEQLEDNRLDLEKEEILGTISLKKQQAIIDQAEITLIRTRNDLEALKIKSPISGSVISLNENLSVTGSYIDQADELFVIADTTQVYFDLEVYEQYATQLVKGDIMTVSVSSNIIDAEVVQIGQTASISSDGLSATVTVRARPLETIQLTSGASAIAEIDLGTKENVLLLPRGSYLTTGSQKYVYKLEGNKAYKTAVTFGDIEGTKVEVVKGLEAGDQIITSGYQNFIDQDVVEINPDNK